VNIVHEMKMLCHDMVHSERKRHAEICRNQYEVYKFLCEAAKDRCEAQKIFMECEEKLNRIRCGM